MRLKDFKLLRFGTHILTDGVNAYYANVFPTYLGLDKSINIMHFHTDRLKYDAYSSILCINTNPHICSTVGSIQVYSKDIDYATQMLEYVGYVGLLSHEKNKNILKKHRMNMKINRKIAS